MIALALALVLALGPSDGASGPSGPSCDAASSSMSCDAPASQPGCDARWEACNAPVWCDTTGGYLPPFSGFCPVGPPDYPPPLGARTQ